MTRSPLPVVLFLSLFAACGGGGSGGGDLQAPPDEFVPEVSVDAGTSGLMNGRWVVVSAEVLPLDGSVNANLQRTMIGPGTEIEFANGVVVSINDDGSAGPISGGGDHGVAANEFFANGPFEDGLTLFASGTTFPGDFLGGGFLRYGVLFGTTSATTAIAESIEEYSFANPPVISRGSYFANLVKL